jgi:hypothetical protein
MNVVKLNSLVVPLKGLHVILSETGEGNFYFFLNVSRKILGIFSSKPF